MKRYLFQHVLFVYDDGCQCANVRNTCQSGFSANRGGNAASTTGRARKTPMEKLEDRTSEVESKVDKLSKLSISGYIQAQYQYGQEYASPKVGNNTNETLGTDDEGGFWLFRRPQGPSENSI